MERYRVLGELGDGAFGTVLKAEVTDTGEVVAIKRLKKQYSSWDECLALREVAALTKLKHPNIVRLKELVHEKQSGCLYFVFEYCGGGNLYSLIKTHGGGLPEELVKTLMFQVCDGLSHMHKHGFFHRDIKPENLLLDGECIKLADVGAARETRSLPPYTDYIGTRWYRAPEVLLRCRHYNSPIDMWSVGCIMAELYTGRPLFAAKSELAQACAIATVLGPPTTPSWPEGVRNASSLGLRWPTTPPTPLESIIPSASAEGLQLMKDLLQWDPNRRPTARNILTHPFFTGLTPAIPDVPPSLPRPGTVKSAHARVASLSGMVSPMVKAVDGDASPVSANTPAAASSSGATPKQPSSLGFQTPKLPPPLLAANASTEESKSLDSPMAALPSTRTSSTIAAVGGLAAFEASIDNDIGALGLDTLSPPNAGSSFRIEPSPEAASKLTSDSGRDDLEFTFLAASTPDLHKTSNNSLAASVQATIGGEDLSLSSAGLDKLLAELGHSSSSPFVGTGRLPHLLSRNFPEVPFSHRQRCNPPRMSTVTGEYSPEALRAVLIGLGLASQFDVQVCEALCDAEPGPGGSYSLKELMAVMRKAGMPATLVMDVRARLLQPTPPVSAGAEEASAGAGVIVRIPSAEIAEKTPISAGAFGSIEKAVWKRTPVILKSSVLTSPDPASVEKELALLSRVKPHPAVVLMLGVCTDCPDGRLRLVLEYCPFGSLKSYLRSLPQPLALPFLLDVCVKAGSGLEHLHSLRIAHRDFRADNVLVSSVMPLVLKVTDFGLAHFQSAASAAEPSKTVTVIGPVAWRAPETLIPSTDGSVVVLLASDVFMFGCFVLEVLTGAEPWAHKQTLPGELQYYRATHPTANPLDDAINDGVFASIVAGGTDTDQFRKVIVLLRLCFAYDASKRPSMTTVLATLSSIAEDTSSASRALYDTLSLDPPAGPPLKPSPTLPLALDPPAEPSFASTDVVTAMEALGLSDVLTSVGETLLMAPDFTQPALVTLLTTAGVKFGVQAKLLKSLAASSASAKSLDEGSKPPQSIMGKPLSSVRIRDSVGNAGLAVVEDGSVMVVSNWKSRLLTVYALPSGDPIRTFGGRGSGPGQFDQPCKMALTPAGGLLVVENENKRVQEVTLNGEHVRFVGAGVIDTLVLGIALLDGCVVVAKSGYRFLSYGPQILVFDYSTGSLLRSFGPLGSRMGQLGFCEGVRATPDGSHIAVCEFNQARLSILTKGGDFVKCVGVGVLSSPFDVEFAPNGDILVADNSNHRICVFSPDGSTLLRSFSSRMDGSQLRSPTALVMSHAKLWVLDHDSDIVTVYS